MAWLDGGLKLIFPSGCRLWRRCMGKAAEAAPMLPLNRL